MSTQPIELRTDRIPGEPIESRDINEIAGAVNDLASNSGTSGTVPIFGSLAEAQAWEAANPGQTAYYITVDDGLTHIVATPPTFTDLSGTEDDTYTIPSLTGAIYKVGGSTVSAGTYSGTGTVNVTAEAESGYALDGTKAWSHTFSSGQAVTPAAPTMNDITDRIFIPSVTGVDYKIGGVTVTGAQAVENLTQVVTVTAEAQSGYTLTGTTSWPLSFTASDAAMPTGAVARYTGATLGAVDSTISTWEDEVGSWDLAAALGTVKVEAEPGDLRYAHANDATLTAAVSQGAPLSIGVQFRYNTWPGGAGWNLPVCSFTGANNAVVRTLESSGSRILQVAAHGTYSTPKTDMDLDTWYNVVVAWDIASPKLRVYLDGTLILTEATTQTIGANTLLTMFTAGNGRDIDVSTLVVFGRSLNESEAIGLCAELPRISGIV